MDFHSDAVKGAEVIPLAQKTDREYGTEADKRVRSIELLISRLLRIGALTSLSVILIGTLLSFIHHTSYFYSPETLQPLILPGAIFPHTLTDIGREALRLQGRAMVMVGLLLLVATPVLLVAVTLFIFFYQRDQDFVIISLLVLLLLMASFFLGEAEQASWSTPINRNEKMADVKE